VKNTVEWMKMEERSFFIHRRGELSTTRTEIAPWTAAEFHRRVLDSNPQVAVFDCDGTLWAGDSGTGFMHWSMEQGLISRSTSDWIDNRHRAYNAGQVSEEDICGEMVQIYAGLRDQELRAAAAQYVSEFVPSRLFAEMTDLVDTLRQSGVELWAVSSTNRWVVQEGVRALGIPESRVLAAEVRIANGLITTEIVMVPTGPAKATALQNAGLPTPDAVFGNSVHDLAMLEIARSPFPINPSPALLAAAQTRGWGYFRPHTAHHAEAAIAGE
jgi:phosphoserine phosphatase